MGGFLERVVLKRRVADDPDAYKRASPLRRVHASAPPFMVIHGTHDALAPLIGAQAFAAQLRSVSRAPVVFLELQGAQHAFEIFHSVRADKVVIGVEQFLDAVHAAYLEARPVSRSPASRDNW
jgi:acetyl esterase/lipase